VPASAQFSITETLNASAATLAVDTSQPSGSLPAGWSFPGSSNQAPIGTGMPAADWIIIEFDLGPGVGLWVNASGAFNGSGNSGGANTTLVAGSSSGTMYLPGGGPTAATGNSPSVPGYFVISNIQPMPNWNISSGVIHEYSGFAKDGSQSMSIGLTAQSGMTGSHSTTHWPFGPNFLAILPTGSATGYVTITFQ